MRVGDILHFSPNYKFLDLKWDDENILIDAFKDRVKGFYLEPAKQLNEDKKGFATGVLCVTTIDFLARIATGIDKVRERIPKWLKDNIEDFKEVNPDRLGQTLADRFYDEFRNGLVHEGRIKNAGQFLYSSKKYDFEELVKIEERIMVVNPDRLLNAINTSFEKYMDQVEKNEFAFHQFRCALIRDFQEDIECISGCLSS